jgi:hypothetical protein
MTATNKRYSYSRVTMIWIDVHPAVENLIDTPHAFHAWFVYGPGPYISHGPRGQPFASRPYISHGPRGQPFASPQKDQTCPYTWWEALATEDKLARPSSWVTIFPFPHDSLGVGERGFTQLVMQLHQLTRPITSACDRYIQYLLTGANPSVLNWHIWGLQPWRCWLSTHHSSTFPTDRPPLSTWGPRPVSSLVTT